MRTPFPSRARGPLGRLGLVLALVAGLSACGGGDDPVAPAPEETRLQDSRTYALGAGLAEATTFDALPGLEGTSRWAGVLGGAAYRVEVPADWNGKLVLYAHGYRGGDTVPLTVSNVSIRRHLLAQGYAWAASSYSKNFYDVRAGVEDTNALANAFDQIAAANGRTLAAPTRRYIIGHSMGGHIAGAAVERETLETANNRVRYDGALPMCGVMGDTELFNTFAGMQLAAQALAGVPAYPRERWPEISALVTSTLFNSTSVASLVSANLPVAGQQFLSVVKHLTGGERPMVTEGFQDGGSFALPWGSLGGDGSINGILNRSVLDTRDTVYRIDGDTDASDSLNARVLRATPAADANRLRRDGLRWIPPINGQIGVPVLSIHTLGDLFVPFSMQQVYKRRVDAQGNSARLVQRAIRGVSHCDFTLAEQATAFDDLVAWVEDGVTPAGDDVLTPATVAAPSYGCAFTDNTLASQLAEESATTVAFGGVRTLAALACAATPAPVSLPAS